MPNLKDTALWPERLRRTKLRTVTDAKGNSGSGRIRQSPRNEVRFARSGNAVAWEFDSPSGGYTGDGEIYGGRSD
jgi:hypothetical protein